MAQSKSRAWIAGTVVVCLLLSIASWFLLVGPKRAEAAELEQQTVDIRASNQQLQARIDQLEAQFAELPQRQAELAEIKQAMPEDPALPTLVRDLDAMAAAAGVTLMSVAPGQPVAVQQPQPAAPAAAPAEGEAAEGEAAEGDAAAAPAPAAPAATAAAANGTVLASVPTNVVVVGDFFKAELFLKNLQADMNRAFLVTTLTVQAEQEAEGGGGKPATENGHVTMTITGSVFVLKTPAAAAAGTTPAPGATTP